MAGSTSFQRLAIRCELRNQNYPTDRVTVMHRDLFHGAGLPLREGNDLDGELCAFTKDEASQLLRQLKGCA